MKPFYTILLTISILINIYFAWQYLTPSREYISNLGGSNGEMDVGVITDGGSEDIEFTTPIGDLDSVILEGGFAFKNNPKHNGERYGEIYRGYDNWKKHKHIDYNSKFTNELLSAIFDYLSEQSQYGYPSELDYHFKPFLEKIKKEQNKGKQTERSTQDTQESVSEDYF